MKIHSEQLFNYLESRGFNLTDEDRANIIEIILFGKNDKGKTRRECARVVSSGILLRLGCLKCLVRKGGFEDQRRIMLVTSAK